MKKIILINLTLIIFVFSSSLFSQEVFFKNKMYRNNNLGKVFVIAFPPNELENYSETKKTLLGINISTLEETQIQITGPNDFKQIYNLTKGFHQINVLEDLMIDIENRIEGEVSKNSLIIESENPINVSVVNSKPVTSEGYTVIPVEKWGNEYINCSYYDFNAEKKWKSGFLVMAYFDNTSVSILLNGRKNNIEKTKSGYEIGDEISVTLNKGEIYMVQGDGETRGTFDLTGSIITGDKNIAVISTSERVMIPSYIVNNGRDHLSEMLFPIHSAGKEFISLEINRETNKGDFFRIVATEDNTYFNVKWYDKNTFELINTWEGSLKKKGDFDEYSKISASMPHENESIRGIAYFNATKPVQVYQYSYSAKWDDNEYDFDPFLIALSPTSQFTNSSVFSVPILDNGQTLDDGIKNEVNLIFYEDSLTSLNEDELLNSIEVNGEKLIEKYPEFKHQKIKYIDSKFNNKMRWIHFPVSKENNEIYSKIPFTATYYLTTFLSSFGTNVGSKINNSKQLDTLKPIVEINQNCSSFKIKIIDSTKFADCSTCQIDLGINEVPFIVESENIKNYGIDYELEIDKSEDNMWYGIPADNELNIKFEIDDPKQDAFIRLQITDATYENVIDTTIYYNATNLEITDFDFGLVKVRTKNIINHNFINLTSNTTTINKIYLKNGEIGFEYKGDSIYTFLPNDTLNADIVYIPKHEYLDAEIHDDGQYDCDTLVFEFECGIYEFILKGQGGESFMKISNWELDEVKISTKVNTNQGSKIDYYIQNYNTTKNRNATFPLNIYGIDLENVRNENNEIIGLAPFEFSHDLKLDNEGNFSKTFTIEPSNGNKKVELNYLNFISEESGTFIRKIIFKTNSSDDELLSKSTSIIAKYVAPQLSVDENNSVFEIFPNPAEDKILIKLIDDNSNFLIKEYRILDLKGNELLKGIGQNVFTIDISQLISGTYLFTCEVDNKPFSKKFIVK